MKKKINDSVQMNEMMAPFLVITASPHMRAHARLLLRRTGESVALIAASKVALMPLEVIAEHST